MSFDPCREWLGIDAVELAEPHRVLGIPPSSIDASSIVRAAEARLVALRGISPGPFARAHAALLDRVVEARDTLLAQVAKPTVASPLAEAPPAADRIGLHPPPAPTRMQPAAEMKGSGGDDHAPQVTLEPVLGDAPEEASAIAAPGWHVPARRLSPPRATKADGTQNILITVGSLGAGAVALIAFFMTRGAGPSERRATPSAPVVRVEPPPTVVGPPASPAAGQPGPRPVRPPQVAAGGPAASPSAVTPPAPVTEADQRGLDERRRLAAEAVEGDLRDAYAALQRGEFDAAERALKTASSRVGDDVEAATRIERWQLLATYARGFAGYRDQAFRAATAGRDYEAEGRRFSVIEITPAMFIYKMAGEIKRVPRDRVDPRISMAVVTAWFAADGRAANHLFLGAHAFCLDPPDGRRARAEWQMAGQGGERVGPLLTLLDDPVIRRAGGR